MLSLRGKVGLLVSRIPKGKSGVGKSLTINQPALYFAASRLMGSSDVGSGSGKGGGSGGRLVKDDTVNNIKSTISKTIKSAFNKLTDLSSSSDQNRLSTSQCDNKQSQPSSVREAGGSMGRKGAAQEEQYFSKQNNAMKEKLKQHLKEEIKQHEDAIKASKELMKEMEKEK